MKKLVEKGFGGMSMARNWYLRLVRSSRWVTKRGLLVTTQHTEPHFEPLPPSLCFFQFTLNPSAPSSSSTAFRFFSTERFNDDEQVEKEGKRDYPFQDKPIDEESTEEWEEEDETEPEIGDGGDGGGIVFGHTSWGQQALDIANEVLLQLSDDFKIFAFKNSPRGYIYLRLDKLSDKYGCPSMEEIEQYSCLYKKRLEEVGELGEIPDDLALEVSSPGAERILKVPDDLDRFRNMPMRVCYVEENLKPSSLQKDGVFLLESIEVEREQCVWRLADVKENRDPLAKGRPLSRKQKDLRLTMPFGSVKRVTLFLDY